jgi:DNA polymerase III sliding clamp (beta) subunit (PCNA family)
MLVKLDNPMLFSKIIEIISELVMEARIKVNEFGLNITAIDPANVAMVNLDFQEVYSVSLILEKRSWE